MPLLIVLRQFSKKNKLGYNFESMIYKLGTVPQINLKSHDMESVLIVDDEQDICYFLYRNLNKKDYEASFVHSLGEAKDALYKKQRSILLLDNHLPDGLGINFAREVKKNYPLMKIVMITAHVSEIGLLETDKTGIDYFISKPFLMSEVFDAIDTVKTRH